MGTKNTINAAEIQNIGRWRSSSQASVPERTRLLALRGGAQRRLWPPAESVVSGTTEAVSRPESVVSVMGDPRIQEAVEDVDNQVDQQVDEHQAKDGADHRRAVLLVDAAVEEVANAVDVEDPLGDDGPAHQRADVDADEGDDRDQGVTQGVYADRARVAQTLGLGCAHVVGA